MPPDTSQDRMDLQQVMLDYAAAVDERDLERYRRCFAEDVEVVGFGDGVMRGRDTWVDYVWTALAKYSATQHLLGPLHATIDGNAARTRSDVQALHILADSGGRFTLWATYHTQLQRSGDGWQITRHELVVRHSETA